MAAPFKEKTIQLALNKLVLQYLTGPSVIELKVTHDHKIALNRLAGHQRNALFAAEYGKFTYKLPDTGYAHKPFDVVLFTGMKAYVAVAFTQSKKIYLVEIDRWIGDKSVVGKKFRFEEEVRQIAAFEWPLLSASNNFRHSKVKSLFDDIA